MENKKERIFYIYEEKKEENRAIEISDLKNFFLKSYNEDLEYSYLAVTTQGSTTKVFELKNKRGTMTEKVDTKTKTIEADGVKIEREAIKWLKKQQEVMVISKPEFWKEVSEILANDVGLTRFSPEKA